MKLLKPLSTFLFILLACSSFAQTGKIRGTIIDDEGETLIGVNVVIEGTDKGAATDLDGDFEITLDTGLYNVRASYVSFRPMTIQDVKVKPNEVTYLGKIGMKENSDELEEVVITAERLRNSEQALLTMKRKSANMIDGISAEKFKETGDGNAAAAMKRVTGVSVQEGKYVYVRGLGDRYTQTLLNGVSVPGLDPNRNSLQMDIFPTNVLANMVVSKSFSAELPASFTGGLVNIQTKEFPSTKTLQISASVGYNPSMHFNSNYLTYDGGNTDFLGFDDGTRAIPTDESNNVPFLTNALGSKEDADRFEQILGGFSPAMSAQREKSFMDYSFGLSAGNQVKKNDLKIGYNLSLSYDNSTEYYDDVEFNFFAKADDPSKYELEGRELQQGNMGVNNVLLSGLGGVAIKSENAKYNLNVLHLQNGEKTAGIYDFTGADQGASFSAKQHSLEYSQRSLTNVLLNGTHFFDSDNWQIDWKLSPTLSIIDDPDIRFSRVRTDGAGFTVGSESGIPQRIWRYLEEENYQGKVDVIREYDFFNDTDAKFKFGASYTYKHRDYEIMAFEIIPQSGVKITSTNPDQIMDEDNLWSQENPQGTIYSPNFLPNNPNKYEANANKASAYVSNEFRPLANLKAITGLRVEQYSQTYTGFDPVKNEDIEDEKVLDDIDLFPAVNLNYSVLEDQNLRFSYSRTIARPSFKETSRATIFDPLTSRTFIGGLVADETIEGETLWNGNLRSTTINNFDLRWEWFRKSGQMLSISGFYKSFDNPIEIVQFVKAPNNVQPRNVGNGSAVGVEVEVRQSLGQFVESLSPLWVNTNVTYTRSRIDLSANELESRQNSAREGQQIDDTRKMAGQAPYIVNAGLSYEGKDNGLMAGIYYNVQGKTLQIVGVSDRPDVFSDPFHSLNLTINKTFGEKDQLSLGLKAENLLGDDKLKFYEAFKAENQVYSKLNPGRSLSFSLGYEF